MGLVCPAPMVGLRSENTIAPSLHFAVGAGTSATPLHMFLPKSTDAMIHQRPHKKECRMTSHAAPPPCDRSADAHTLANCLQNVQLLRSSQELSDLEPIR